MVNWSDLKSLTYSQIGKLIAMECSYEPNNEKLWDRVKSMVDGMIVDPLVGLGVLADANVCCNSSVNTPDVIGQNKFKLIFAWKETKDSEFTIASFVLGPEGLDIASEGERK